MYCSSSIPAEELKTIHSNIEFRELCRKYDDRGPHFVRHWEGWAGITDSGSIMEGPTWQICHDRLEYCNSVIARHLSTNQNEVEND